MSKFPTILTLSLLGFLQSAQAQWPMLPWDGNFLIGASGARAERLDNVDITLFYTFPGNTIPVSFIIEDYTDTGYLGGFFAGYQIYVNRFVIGAEFNVDWDYLDRKHFFGFSDANGQVGVSPGLGYAAMARYERDVTYALSARVGYEITRCFMPYFRLGVAKSKDTLTVAFAGDPAIYNFNVITQGDGPQIRYLLGIGAEIPMPLLPFIGLRGEYNFQSRAKNIEALGSINDGALNPFFMNKMNPKTHIAKLSVVWNI
ncbi:MAG: outer membrane protein [Candidatus Berkiella sp.]